MKILTFSNSKGGVGKTTITTGVARTLSALGKKVLIIDIDPQGNITNVFRHEENKNEDSTLTLWFELSSEIKDIEKWKQNIINGMEETNTKNIFLVPAYKNIIKEKISKLQMSNVGVFVFEKNVNQIKKILEKLFDYVLIDTNPTMTILTTNIFITADQVIFPIEPHKFSVEGIGIFFEDYSNTIKELQEIKSDIKQNLNYILFNKVGKNKMDQAIIEQYMNSNFKNQILNTKIPYNQTMKKQTMMEKINLTDKSPYFELIKELNIKGVI
ncbi:MAG: ParA family protein [Spiroplasma sp. hy2]|uniref:ParA family protein n=1 Tax=Spiroplasma sp. hy2 TaxID=2490850 RepID=UPI00383F68DF